MATLVEILLAAAIGIGPSAVEPKPQTFSPYKNFQGEYQLNIDENSLKLIGDTAPLVLVDIQIVMDKPVRYIDTPALVKSYQNSVAVDCPNDRIIVIVGRAFNAKGTLIYTTPRPEIVNNNRQAGSPATELLQLFCPPNLEQPRQNQPRLNTIV